MAINVSTATPRTLLSNIKKAIDAGKVKTWQYDADGDFTHAPEQWRDKAWLRPKIENDRLVFTIITPRATNMSSLAYAIYHGRFIEMLLNHFDMEFTEASATALPTKGDITQA